MTITPIFLSTRSTELLGGLSIGEIPIAGSKRPSFRMNLDGKTYRVGRIWANRAFVVVRGNLRLLYVSTNYLNYAAVARRVFGDPRGKYEYDHALGRKIAESFGFQYILILRSTPAINRSHGFSERFHDSYRITINKFCYIDDRILKKMLGTAASQLSAPLRTSPFRHRASHRRRLSIAETRLARHALGMDDREIDYSSLHEILR
ncbi:hypothetical protein [Sphingomonas sp. 8AM]|uniref:hypothetical protein n=1 Tax=Sphingomonas sp. 8AM TaxID=2653170 RepID=UPI00135A6285|nr:hypothetical protein [Sphingomonas sp. 8AM]